MTTQRFDDLTAEEIYANPRLREYLAKVQKRHGYVRLLSLPDRGDRGSVPIKSIFVPPIVSKDPITADSDPMNWREHCQSIHAALEHHRRVVLLGDPGTGKTTLFDYWTWTLTYVGRPTPFTKRFGWVLPVPIVLRDLAHGSFNTFDGLLEAFLQRPVGEPLRGDEYLSARLEEGRALLMLDGMDEFGDKEAKRRLRDAVFDGMRRYPNCLWLLSSRIVGYGDAPLEGSRLRIADVHNQDVPSIGKRYLVPFDDGRIKAFVHNWYTQRDWDALNAGRNADLTEAIRQDPALQRLARVPNTLALMALVHRNEAMLPHERSLLYERIAEAYLESIDKHRGIGENANDLPRKKMWLARVGYELQRRQRDTGDTGCVAQCEDVLRWIDSEMERTKAPADAPKPQHFLSSVSRRSGLFIPKADDQYAFSHPSFQAYFAAAALEAEVTGFKWAREGCSTLGFGRVDVAAWGRQEVWRETFLFLFEMLAGKPEWHGELLECVFGKDFAGLHVSKADEGTFNLGCLAARLAVNPYAGLGQRERANAIEACVSTQIRCSDYFFRTEGYGPDRSLIGFLMATGADQRAVMTAIRRQWPLATDQLQWKILDLRGARGVDLQGVAKLRGLKALILADTDVSDIRPLTELDGLGFLELDGTVVEDIAPLAALRQLDFLNLERTSVRDITPLACLDQLDAVLLSGSSITDDAALALHHALPNCDVVMESLP